MDDDFRSFLIAFHKLPSDWNLRILGFHALGTTSIILKIQTADHGVCALKLLQAPYVRVLSMTHATKAYEKLSRSLDSKYSPDTFDSAETWILMQFVNGLNLAQFLDKLQRDPLLRFMGQGYVAVITRLLDLIVDALSHYEEKRPSVIHGDLNPYNIIVEGPFTAPAAIKLIDFGPNFVLRERISNPRLFAETFAWTELFAAHEVVLGQPPTIKSDVYSLGMIGLALLSREPLRRDKLGPLLEKMWREPLSMGLAQMIEDVIDDNPDNRLLVTPIDYKFGVYRSINRFLQEQVELIKHIKTTDTSSALNVVWAVFKTDPAKAIESLEHIHQNTTLWEKGVTRTQIRLAKVNAVLSCSIMILCGLYTLVDLRVVFFPNMDFVFEKSITALPHRFTVGDLWNNLPGRAVALTFGIVAGHYYANIFSMLRMHALEKSRQWLVSTFVRINAVSYFFLILPAIVWDPQWWPWCACVGTLFPAINNLLCYHTADRIAIAADGVFSSSYPLNPQGFVRRYQVWGTQMLMYSVLLLAFGILLSSGAAKDDWVYASIVCGINIFKIYPENCKALAPETLGNLARLSLTARRLLARASAPTVGPGAMSRRGAVRI